MKATENTKNTKNTNENKEEKKMKNIRTASISENVNEARENLSKDIKKAINTLNHVAREKRHISAQKVSDALSIVKKDASALNELLALEYYKNHTVVDIVKAGKAVPAVVTLTETDKETNTVTVKADDVTVYPTLSGMVSAGLLTKDVLDTVDMLRRVVASLKGDALALTGDIENKKDVPSKAVAGLIEKQGELSETKARAIMAQAVKEVTGGAFTKAIFPKVYKDFAEQITRRGKEWGERTHIGKATANDLILEYLYMSLNGKTAFQFVID